MKIEYPYTDKSGVFHASARVEVYIDIDGVRGDLETEDWEVYNEVGDGREVRRCYLGSWLSMSPSGKIYAPWANSNVAGCPVCDGSGDVPNPLKHRLRVKYRNKAERLRKRLLRYHGFYYGGTWPPHLSTRLRRWDNLGREDFTCPRCGGLGSAEAHDDELFTEALDDYLEHESDLYIEYHDGDIFVTQYREATKEENVNE